MFWLSLDNYLLESTLNGADFYQRIYSKSKSLESRSIISLSDFIMWTFKYFNKLNLGSDKYISLDSFLSNYLKMEKEKYFNLKYLKIYSD